jgi:HSP20 family protein
VVAEVPGMRREDLEISVHDGLLTVGGLRPERAQRGDHYHRVERGRGNFRRTFQLPVPVDADRVTADLRDGVLTVTCPKAANSSSRRIQVS